MFIPRWHKSQWICRRTENSSP